MARLGCLIYFRKIFLLNRNRVPVNGPLLMVCNHPSSFFEACLLAVILPRPLYFLTRGDFFKGGIISWFLRQTHQIPIFRSQDGFEKLRNNPDTFSHVYKALKENKAVLIFPESWTILEKRLRPMQKGASRLALGALQHVPSLNILPVGVTFSNPTKFRSTVTVQFGELIPVIRPSDNSVAEERNIMSSMTAQIETALKSLIVIIPEPEREPLYDAVQYLVFNASGIESFPVISDSAKFPEKELTLAAQVNEMPEIQFQAMASQSAKYTEALRQLGVNDRFFHWTCRLPATLRFLLVPFALLLLPAKLIFTIPLVLILRTIRKVRKPPFYGPVKWVMGFYGLTIWSLTLLIIVLCIGNLTVVLIMLAWLLLGVMGLMYVHDIGLLAYIRTLLLPEKQRDNLLEQRKEIVRHFA